MEANIRKDKIVQLVTNDDSKVLVLSSFSGNQREPHNCEVEIKSGAFGFRGLFYFDNFSDFTASIEEMSVKITGNAELREDYKNQGIKLELSKLGHVSVTGTMEQHGGYSQVLSFGFKTDQTCLAQFGRDLRKIIAQSN